MLLRRLKFGVVAGMVGMSVAFVAEDANRINAQERQSEKTSGNMSVNVILPTIQSANETLKVSAEQFEVWAKSEVDSMERTQFITKAQQDTWLKRLQLLEDALKARLQADRYVTDASVITVVAAWIDNETPRRTGEPVRRDATGHRFPESRRVIASLLPLVSGRRSLEARLHEEKARLFKTDNDLANAIKEYEAAVRGLTTLHLDVDVRRIGSLVEMARTLFLAGDRERSDKLYLQALSYSWFNVDDPEAFQRLRDLYLAAGRGLIEVRQNNLKTLKEIRLWPAAKQELGPDLQEAIREAGGSEEEVAAVMKGFVGGSTRAKVPAPPATNGPIR